MEKTHSVKTQEKKIGVNVDKLEGLFSARHTRSKHPLKS